MNTFRVALANIQYPASPEESIALAEHAIAQASVERAGLVCFPECYIPGYRGMGKHVPPPDPASPLDVQAESVQSSKQEAASRRSNISGVRFD